MKKIYIFLFTLLICGIGFAQSTINITTSGGSYATEKWVSITTGIDGSGTQVWGQGDGSYGNGEGLINEDISIAPGTYYVNCYDKYSDGWDGTLISVTAYGNVIGNNGGASPNDPSTVDSTSSWETPADELEASFEIIVPVPPTCPDPSGLMLDSTIDTEAQISWTAGSTETDWEIVVQAPGTGEPAGSGTATTNNPYTASGLTGNTAYEVYVRAFCGGSDYSAWIGPLNFTTACSSYTPDYTEDFTTFLNPCWEEATGPITGPTAFGSAGWTADGFANSGSTGSARFNIYSTGGDDWLLTPIFDLTGGGYEINLDVALTNFGATTAGTIEADDAVYVMQSIDGGATWTTIYTWDNSNVPSNTGDNLIIDISAVTSATTQFAIFALEGATSGGDYDFFIDNFKVRTPPSCPDVTGLTLDSVTAEEAQISWTAGGTETDWEIVVQADGTGTPVGSGTPTTDNPYTAMSLTSNTAYEVYVRADCGGSLGAWIGPLDFTTACIAVSDFSENFDAVSTPDLPNCWSSVIDNGASSFAYVETSTSADNSAPNGVNLYNSGSGSTSNIMLVSPELSNLGDGTHQLRFYGRNSTSTQDIEIGTLSDPTDGSTFTVLTTVDLSTTHTEYEVSFAGYSGTDNYIAIRRLSTSTYTNVYLDDIIWEPLPTCPKPTDLTIDSFTDTTAQISWTNGGSETDWEIVVQAPGTGEPAGSGTATTDNPHGATGLTGNTTYEVYVRAFCGGSDYSTWVGPVEFTTECSVLTPDYTQDFTTFLDPCWEEGADGDLTSGPASTGSANWSSEEFAHTATSGLGAVNINIYGSNDIEWLLSPYFDLSAGGYEIVVDVALTDYNATTQDDGFDADDEVRLVYSTDGTNWVTIETWNQSNTPAVAGETVSFDISPLTASNVQFAFYVAENTDGGVDIDFHVDNFNVSAITPTDTADFINLQWPGTASIVPGGSFTAYAQIYEPGTTDAVGQGANVEAWIGVSATNATTTTDFISSDWTWIPATYNTDTGNNDEYQATLGATLPVGTHYYVSRFSVNGGPYSYGGNDISDGDGGNFWDGSSYVSGVLTVNATPEPTNHVLTFAAVADSDTEITLTWDDNNGAQAAEGFLIVAKTGAATLYVPVDGTDDADDTDWSDDEAEVKVAPGVQTYTFTGLTASTLYEFEIYPYTNSGSNIDYKTDGTVPSASATTDADPCAVAITTFPYEEGFENGGVIPDCWTQEYEVNTADWVFASGATSTLTTPHTGSYNARFYSPNYSGDQTKLVTPMMDISGLTNPTLSFWYAQPAWGGDQDELRVYYKTSTAGSWTLIPGQVYTSSVTTWTEVVVTLPSPSAEYYIAFDGTSGYGYGTVVDDVKVEEDPVISYTYNGTWSPSDPNGAATTNDDIVVTSGNAAISTDTNCNSVTVNPGASMTVNSGATLTVATAMTLESASNDYSNLMLDGTVSGTVIYERYTNANSNGNDLISPPLGGQTWADFLADGSNAADLLDDGNTSPTTYLFGPFDKTTDDWLLYTDATVATLNSGTGYRAGTDAGTTLSFTGSVETSMVTVNIEDTGANFPDWNLIGNPYTTYLDMTLFLNYDLGDGTTNIDLLEDVSGIYGYDGSASNGWDVITLANASAKDMTPGQGFFVAANDAFVAGYDITFDPSMRVAGSGDDFIVGRNSSDLTYLKLNTGTATKDFTTQFYFNDNATAGLDHGYDAQIWGGTIPSFALYSNLVQDNTGMPIALQALNTTDLANTVIPLGVNANAGEQLTFTISETTLPSTVNVYLDDTLNNTTTLLNTSDYVINPISDITGTGRFYIRFAQQSLSTTDVDFDNLKIYTKTTPRALYVHGVLQGETTAKVYDLQGRLVHHSVLNSNNLVNQIDASDFSDGVYVVTLSNGVQEKSQKVIIR
ncbi:T9SS type A sorting domain-containing protein [Winogradskyella poriferorum]|uniref:T9SS type A sorting domain-containing protein n=1 Tax=Winogradskyella poriferorum TaxID=307627 RepID=UPI003D65E704